MKGFFHLDSDLGLSIKCKASKERFSCRYQDSLLSGDEVVGDGSAEGGSVLQITFLGGVGRVPCGFKSQVDGARGRVLGHPVLADAKQEVCEEGFACRERGSSWLHFLSNVQDDP